MKDSDCHVPIKFIFSTHAKLVDTLSLKGEAISMESFDSTKKGLYEILKDVDSGKLQLPDFQRGWVWDDDRIKGIIASIAKSFPIGAIMLLETGNDNIRFKTKPVEGTDTSNVSEPELLILDGQQRITSLYQVIFTKNPVNTQNAKKHKITRWYYIDMQKALTPDGDIEEAIFSISENKLMTENIGRDIRLDLSSKEKEYEAMMYPVSMLDRYSEWRKGFNKFWNHDAEKSVFCDEFEEKIVDSFKSYMIPVIMMKKENPKEAVCQVFEKVNTGGVSLTVFELLTATFASEEFDLKEDWQRIQTIIKPHRVLEGISNTDVLQSITLYSTYKRRRERMKSEEEDSLPPVSAKRKEMLNLPLDEYRKHQDRIVEGYVKASKILTENRIFHARDLPYGTQLIPMAAILAELGDDIDNAGKKKKLMRWFWCGVLGELYGSANETRYALDMTQVVEWIRENGDEPKTVLDANFSASRLGTLRTRNSAAYKGIYALLMEESIKDWLSAAKIDFCSYFSESIDIHHIFPVAWCEKKGIHKKDYNSIINKTPLSGRTNRIVGGDAPSKYLERLKKHAGVKDAEFEAILRSHAVNPDLMYQDDFKAFFADRKERILQRIENAMGKEILRTGVSEEEMFYGEEDED